MSPHDFCRDHLGEFLDQTLEPSTREKVAAHLVECADCAQIAREADAIRATLREFKPVAAPPMLRQNVRAALQNQGKAPVSRPIFVWRLPPLAWSGTLAFAALALIVLARPFATAPVSLSPEATVSNDALPAPPAEIAPAPQTATKASPAPQTAPRRLQQAPKVVTQPDSTAVMKGNGSSNALPQLGVVRPAPKAIESTKPRRIPQKTPRFERPQAGFVAPQFPFSIPTLPAPRTNTAPQPAPTAPRSSDSALSAPQGVVSGAVAPPLGASRAANGAFSAPEPMLPRQDTVRDTVRARQSAAAPLFSLQLRATPAPGTLPLSIAGAREAGARKSAVQDEAPTLNGTLETEKSAAAADGASGSSPDKFSRMGGMRQQPRLAAPETRGKIRSSADSDTTAFRAPTSGEVRRFELQVQTPRAIPGARVRLSVPPSLRLLWPASATVWSGNFDPETAVSIPFSLGNVRGGEEISVVVEQKVAGGPSRTLQTQTLILPPSKSE